MRGDTKSMGSGRLFQTTRWTLVLAAGDLQAMGDLIRIYWKPLYFFVRHHGYDVETSKDIVQAFLAGLLEHGSILKADPARGRFRSFLQGALTNFLKDWAKSANRQKRRPPRLALSLDFARGETDYAMQVSGGETPERALNRAWAHSLWDRAIEELKGERSHLEAFRLYLANADYEAIAAKTGLSVAAAKTAVHRLKGQLREFIVSRIRETVSNEKDLESEIEEFKSLLARTR